MSQPDEVVVLDLSVRVDAYEAVSNALIERFATPIYEAAKTGDPEVDQRIHDMLEAVVIRLLDPAVEALVSTATIHWPEAPDVQA